MQHFSNCKMYLQDIGLPFYGRSFGAATGLNQPHSGADQVAWGIDDGEQCATFFALPLPLMTSNSLFFLTSLPKGTPQYFNIVAQLPSMTSVWDKTTWTQYAYFENGGLVSYDNENAICAKVQYANENSLGGFIIWELSGDLMDDLSTPLLDVTNIKLNNPDFNCGESGLYPDEDEDVLIVQATVPSSGSSPAPDTSISSVSFPTPSTQVSPTDSLPTSSTSTQNGTNPAYLQCGGAGSTFNVADSKSIFRIRIAQAFWCATIRRLDRIEELHIGKCRESARLFGCLERCSQVTKHHTRGESGVCEGDRIVEATHSGEW